MSINAVELKAFKSALSAKLAELERIAPTCDHCLHFAQAPHCAKFGATPPEEFRRTPESCPEWEWDSIPF